MCFDGATPVDGNCPTPDPSIPSCHALGCPGSPPEEPLGPIEVKPIAIVDELPAEEDEILEEEQQDYAEEDDESGSPEDEDVEESESRVRVGIRRRVRTRGSEEDLRKQLERTGSHLLLSG